MNVMFGPQYPYKYIVAPGLSSISLKWLKLMKRLMLLSKGFVRHFRDRYGKRSKAYRWVHSILLQRAATRGQLVAPRVYAPEE